MFFGRSPNAQDARNRLGQCILLTLVTCGPSAAGISPTNGREFEIHARARKSILADDLYQHVQLLANDTLEGREAGSRGGYTAGNYAVQTFQKYLEPGAGDRRYFQVFGNRYRNVLGVLPGRDPKLRDEYILVGAHYDHVGYGSRRNSNGPIGFIHNGADDNASGVSAVLEMIDAFGETGLQPRRSILFALWDAEEKGLLGSKHWAHHPTVPREQIRLVINLDMIGRLRDQSLEILGTRSMPGLRRQVSEANFTDSLKLTFPWKLEPNSDHHSFFTHAIPVLMYHTGLHDDYHRPSDDTEKVNLEGLQAATQLVFNTLTQLADDTSLAKFRRTSRHEGEQRQREFERPLPAPAPRLGISWQPVDPTSPPGLILETVRPGSAADRAGLRPADRLISLDGRSLLSSSTLQQAAVTAVELRLTVARDGEDTPLELTVPLDGTPSRIGISWRYSAAEPNSVVLVRVIRHSPADQAGLHVGDRIHQLDGAAFHDSLQFRQLSQQIKLPAAIRVERAGRILELTIPSPPNDLNPTDEQSDRPA